MMSFLDKTSVTIQLATSKNLKPKRLRYTAISKLYRVFHSLNALNNVVCWMMCVTQQ